MLMPGRKYSSDKYRYGFNGKENDNEVKGDGNQQDYGMRVYDGRIGKFLSVDPLTRGFANLTPFQFASNSPIANIDLDGGEAKYFNITVVKTFDGKGKLVNETSTQVEDRTKEAGWFAAGAFIYRPCGDLGNGTLISFTDVSKTLNSDGSESISIHDFGAFYLDEESSEGRGGLYFISSSGGFGHKSGSLSGKDAIPINIDILVSAVGGFPKGNADTEMSPFQHSGDEVAKLNKLFALVKSDEKFAIKMDKLLAG